MANDREPSVPSLHGSGCSYADVSIYVDAVDEARVVAWLQGSLGFEDNGPCLTVEPLRVSGGYNGYATGRRSHPFDFLEWPTVLECEASAGAPAEVVQAVAAVLEALWRGGFKAVAACDFEDELTARGGAGRYPVPPASGRSPASACSWWRNLISPGKRRGGIL